MFKEQLTNWFKKDDLLYVQICIKNSGSCMIHKYNSDLKLMDDFLIIYVHFDQNQMAETIIPYENISHMNAMFGDSDNVSTSECSKCDELCCEDCTDTE